MVKLKLEDGRLATPTGGGNAQQKEAMLLCCSAGLVREDSGSS